MNNSLAGLGFDTHVESSIEPVIYGARKKLAESLQNNQGYPAAVVVALGTITPDIVAALEIREKDFPTILKHSLTGLMIDPEEVGRWDSYSPDHVRVFPYSGSDIANQFQQFPGSEYQFTHKRWIAGDLEYINSNSLRWKALAERGWNPMYHPTAQDKLRWPSVAHFSKEAVSAAKNLGSVTAEILSSAREKVLAHYLAQADHGDFFPDESSHRHPKTNHRYENLLELLEAQFEGQPINPEGYAAYLIDVAERHGVSTERLDLLLTLVTTRFRELENKRLPEASLHQAIKVRDLLQNNIFDPRWLHWFREDNRWTNKLNLEVVADFDLPYGFDARTGIITDPNTAIWTYAASAALQNPAFEMKRAVGGLLFVNSMFRKNTEHSHTWVSSRGVKVEIPHVTEYGKMFAYIIVEHKNGNLLLFVAPTAGEKIDERVLYTFLGEVEMPKKGGKSRPETKVELKRVYGREVPEVKITKSEEVVKTQTRRKTSSKTLPLPKE